MSTEGLNTQAGVVEAMRLLRKRTFSKEEFDGYLAQAHAAAEAKATGLNQADYEIAFTLALNNITATLAVTPEDLGLPPTPEPKRPLFVATEVTEGTAKGAPRTVEDWEKLGLRFSPAFVPVLGCVQRLQRPDDTRKDRRGAVQWELAEKLEPPWGCGAKRLAAWAWQQCGGTSSLSSSKIEDMAKVLSILYYAGVMRDGAFTPLGRGKCKIVRRQPC